MFSMEKQTDNTIITEENKDIIKQISVDFFRWWWNQPGNNTEEGFDFYWDKFIKNV